MKVSLDHHALRGLDAVDSLLLHRGRLIVPVPQPTVRHANLVENIQTDLRLLPNDQWEPITSPQLCRRKNPVVRKCQPMRGGSRLEFFFGSAARATEHCKSTSAIGDNLERIHFSRRVLKLDLRR